MQTILRVLTINSDPLLPRRHSVLLEVGPELLVFGAALGLSGARARAAMPAGTLLLAIVPHYVTKPSGQLVFRLEAYARAHELRGRPGAGGRSRFSRPCWYSVLVSAGLPVAANWAGRGRGALYSATLELHEHIHTFILNAGSRPVYDFHFTCLGNRGLPMVWRLCDKRCRYTHGYVRNCLYHTAL